MIIDFHTHVFPPWLRENRVQYLGTDACFGELYSDPRARMATADELIASMDQSGVDVSVVLNIGWHDLEMCVRTNDYILESVARFPRRLVGFCTIQPGAGEAALSEVERCVKGGVRGIGEMRPDTQEIDFSGEQPLLPLVSLARKHDLIILTHSSEPVGHQYPGKGEVTPGKLWGLISAFKDVNVVCAHWGGGLPFYLLMPEVRKALQKVYFDTAASRYLYQPEVYAAVSRIMGSSDRILMGSDFPLISQARQLEEVNSAGITAEQKSAIAGGNAERLLRATGSI
ncbi:MAG: amidohydrolase [Chloroflexi bacterium]|nr:amidohydrolase [Chloroflexota bacterium]